MADFEIEKGSASSITDISPLASRLSIALRVESERAEKIVSSWAELLFTIWCTIGVSDAGVNPALPVDYRRFTRGLPVTYRLFNMVQSNSVFISASTKV